MFLTHCIVLLTLLSLCLPTWTAVNVYQQYRVDSINGTARVQCTVQPQPSSHQIQTSQSYPYPDPQEVRVSLLKGLHGSQEFCSSILNFTQQRDSDIRKDAQVQCSVQVKEGAVEVIMSGLKTTDTDIYRCKIEVLYPPPYLSLIGNGTLIHVLGSSDCSSHSADRQIGHQSNEEQDDENDERLVSLPVVILVVLVIFVLTVIIYLQAVQYTSGKRETVRAMTVGEMRHKADMA